MYRNIHFINNKKQKETKGVKYVKVLCKFTKLHV